MEPLFYVMAIMGCADGSANCAESRIEPARYSTIQQCQSQMAVALTRNTDIDSPVITATCRASGQRMVEKRADKRSS